jgi:glycosyltransferase involved in cell wall biosynthesis
VNAATRSDGLVSIIIIFLNEQRFIGEAIESVIAQTYDHWELFLVDDGSIDNSTEIAQGYAREYPKRIRYLEHPGHQNRGMSRSRNLGIQGARGEFLAFLDADDVWLPRKLARQLAILDEQPDAGMVYGSTELWHSWRDAAGAHNERDSLQPLGVTAETLVPPPHLLTRFVAREAITPCPSDVLLRRTVLDDIGAFEDEFTGMYEDQVFFAKVTLKWPVFVSGECWDRHRQHQKSASATWKQTGEYRAKQPNVAFVRWLMSYLQRQGNHDRTLRRLMKRRLRRYEHPVLFRLWRYSQHLLRTHALS